MCTVAQGGRLLLSLWVCLLLASLASAAQPRQAPRVPPRCDLETLNVFYVALLNQERRKVNAVAPTAHFDKVLLIGTVQHNEKMQVLDSLFHDTANPIAELVGTLLEDDPVAPDKLARLIWRRLNASRQGHREIQASAERLFISVAATAGYYTIRLARVPGGTIQRPHPHRS